MEKAELRLRKNIIPWLKDQLSRPAWFKNFFITRNAWASFSVNSHIRHTTGTPKKTYATKEAALKVAEEQSFKLGVHFSVYKCLYCDGWHCGKNNQNKLPEPKNEKEKYLFMAKEVLQECLVMEPVETLKKLRETGVMQYIIPELEKTYEKRSACYSGTVWEHTMLVVQEIEKLQGISESTRSELVMAALMLEIQNDEMMDEAMETLKFSKNEIKDVRQLIRFYTGCENWIAEGKQIMDSELRKLQYDCKTEERFNQLMTLIQAENKANSEDMQKMDQASIVLERTEHMKAEGTAMFAFKGLLTSKEIMQIKGLKPGPQIKECLDYLLELAFKNPKMDREQVIKALTEFKL